MSNTPARPQLQFARPPQTPEELWEFVRVVWGVTIPRRAVCPGHVAPFDVFKAAYFAEAPIIVLLSSRGFGGKSFLKATLTLTEAVTLGVQAAILGGSGEQSNRVIAHMNELWRSPRAPTHLLRKDPAKTHFQLTNSGRVEAQQASARSVRGGHPARLRIDEADELDIELLDAALGQPMFDRRKNVASQTLIGSTRQYADGTMAKLIQRCAEREGYTFMTYCYKENMAAPDGWLTEREVEQKRQEVTDYMWCFPADAYLLDNTARPTSFKEADAVLDGDGVAATPRKRWQRDAIDEQLVCLQVQGIPEPLRLTPNHVVLTADGPKRADALEAWSTSYNPQTQRRGRGDMLLSPRRVLQSGGDEELGWFVGFYLAEGHTRKERGNGIVFSVSEQEGPVIQQRINRLLARFPYEHVVQGFAPGPARQKPNGRGAAQVTFSHLTLRRFLEEWVDTRQLARAKHLRQLPQEEAFTRGLLMGWLEGDGAVTSSGWVGVTYSEELAWQMLQIATDLGYSTGMTKSVNKGLSRNLFWHVHVSHMNPRKGGLKDLGRFAGRRIRRIWREEYSGELWDLEVPTTHSYLVAGVVVHNSTEYVNAEPNPENRAISTELVDRMFSLTEKIIHDVPGKYYEFEPPDENARYVTGVDWAKAKDHTVIATLRIDCSPARLVAYERVNKQPWPKMAAKLNDRLARFPGPCAHDSTGVGGVVSDMVDRPLIDFTFQGRKRDEMLSAYISAVESEHIQAPLLNVAYQEHKFATNDDVFGSGHLPDTMSAFALAWHARGSRIKVRAYTIGSIYEVAEMIRGRSVPNG